MEVVTLASGSSGNCALIRAGSGLDRTTLVLDCGVALRTARDLALVLGVELGAVDGVLLSHHHSDHSAKVLAVAARARCPLWAHPQALTTHPSTSESERRRRKVDHRPFTSGQWFEAGSIRCLPVRLSHDAEPTHGFLFEADGVRAGFFTDLGTTDALPRELVEDLELLVLESNHDHGMLRDGRYPPHLKRRVGGDQGHLSNGQAAELLRDRCPPGLRALALAHLSERNNAPSLALEAAGQALRDAGRGDLEPQVAPKRGILRLELAT
ncbi:MAG: MBL fold metallo-hydrolase [Planctomycetes bacterium]|nr:MBL fold metallo-hydrolase [Planctomycetota bacterium]